MASKAEANTFGVENENAGGDVPPYAKSNLRVSKDNTFMILALRMEGFPVDEVPTKFVNKDPCRKVGAVLVLPNDIAWAADCSRDGVHAVARLLMKHHDKAKGCKMFMSRKPCPTCAKLLVQSKVKQVLYLWLEPEYYRSPEAEPDDEKRKTIDDSNDAQMKGVDTMFTASAIAQTKFVLQVEESVLKKTRYETPTDDERKGVPMALKNELIKTYLLDANWLKVIEEKLPWPAFDKIKDQVEKYFNEVMEWLARVIILSGQSGGDKSRGRNYNFQLSPLTKQPPDSNQYLPYPPFNPAEKDSTHEKQAKHFIEIARFLAQRTDDPITGVGAVIVSYPEMEILSIGWNGFPRKAHFGEFPRASEDNDAEDNSYVIHAEQNALMMRNNKSIKGAIMFVTRSPCDECAPLIAMESFKTVVVDADVKFDDNEPDQYKAWPAFGCNVFPGMVEERKFVCYQTKRCATDEKNIPASVEKSKDMTAMVDKSEK